VGAWRAAAVLVLISVVLVGCYSGDFRFHVRNETDQTWLLRVAIGGQWGPNDFWVASVKPGADGIAFDWYGAEDKPIQLLTLECDVVGVFAPDAEGVLRVAEVPGITGTVTAIGRQVPQPRSPDNERISREGGCGGMVPM
jgi:hypothetical protein